MESACIEPKSTSVPKTLLPCEWSKNSGAWRDHYVFALTHEEVIGGVLNRWIMGQVPTLIYPWAAESRSGIKHTELNADELGS
jgi:hypothetical protein